jgi:hypothetical protein
MSYTVATTDNGAIILVTMGEDYDVSSDMLASSEETFLLLENGPDRIVMITDARLLKVNSLEDILQGGKTMTDPRIKRTTVHPKLIKSLSVINSRLLQLAVKGLNSASFGHTDIPVYDSMEEAYNVARKLLYGESAAAG